MPPRGTRRHRPRSNCRCCCRQTRLVSAGGVIRELAGAATKSDSVREACALLAFPPLFLHSLHVRTHLAARNATGDAFKRTSPAKPVVICGRFPALSFTACHTVVLRLHAAGSCHKAVRCGLLCSCLVRAVVSRIAEMKPRVGSSSGRTWFGCAKWTLLFAFALRGSLGATLAPASPKVVLILVDGVRWDYLSEQNLPGFSELASTGVKAEYVVPIMPANSYPNWYSIVTETSGTRTGFHIACAQAWLYATL
ncbi:hypothetical protein HPB48_004014 [Haemaphysalis longicornis]|uniref:glycerophosphocholine cholinephosphodiesterase n=1 Tax=Haemaphysalis longicornis TaxID=44386 RepID=A0A9J6FXC7_HAELO|nr:hypothetical protein HPB48_004014 [Haemaphysalis longicornis]